MDGSPWSKGHPRMRSRGWWPFLRPSPVAGELQEAEPWRGGRSRALQSQGCSTGRLEGAGAFGPWRGASPCARARRPHQRPSPRHCAEGIRSNAVLSDSMFCQKYGKRWMGRGHTAPWGVEPLGVDVGYWVRGR